MPVPNTTPKLAISFNLDNLLADRAKVPGEATHGGAAQSPVQHHAERLVVAVGADDGRAECVGVQDDRQDEQVIDPSRKIYLSGPMMGIPDNNAPAFNAAAAQLRAMGYTVVSPVELDAPDASSSTLEQYLRRDLKIMLDCDGIVFLDGYINSKGAMLQAFVAHKLGMPDARFSDFLVEAST